MYFFEVVCPSVMVRDKPVSVSVMVPGEPRSSWWEVERPRDSKLIATIFIFFLLLCFFSPHSTNQLVGWFTEATCKGRLQRGVLPFKSHIQHIIPKSSDKIWIVICGDAAISSTNGSVERPRNKCNLISRVLRLHFRQCSFCSTFTFSGLIEHWPMLMGRMCWWLNRKANRGEKDIK